MNQNSPGSDIVPRVANALTANPVRLEPGFRRQLAASLSTIAPSRMCIAVSAQLNPNEENECTQAVSDEGFV